MTEITMQAVKPEIRKKSFTKDDFLWVLGIYGCAVGGGSLFWPISLGLSGFWAMLILTLIAFPITYYSYRVLCQYISSGTVTAESTSNIVDTTRELLGDAPTFDVDHEKADEHLVPSLVPGLSHLASTEHRFSQNLRNLTCRERVHTALAHVSRPRSKLWAVVRLVKLFNRCVQMFSSPGTSRLWIFPVLGCIHEQVGVTVLGDDE